MSWGARFAFTGHSRGFSEVSIGHPAGFLIFTAPPAGSVARYGRITGITDYVWDLKELFACGRIETEGPTANRALTCGSG